MGAHKRTQGGDETKVSELFSGKTVEGTKRLDHGHVYILPLESNSRRGRIDRVLIYSQLRSFTSDELDAVRGVRELYQSSGRPEIRCVLTWQGTLAGSVARRRTHAVISTTPFVSPRHWRKGRDFEDFLKKEIRRECGNHGIESEPSEIERGSLQGNLFDCIEYRRNRKEDPVRPGYAFRLRFPEPVLAPFAIGYGAHFGLGQFHPAE